MEVAVLLLVVLKMPYVMPISFSWYYRPILLIRHLWRRVQYGYF